MMQNFDEWMNEVRADAQAKFGQPNVAFAIGDADDMRPSFEDGISASDYVDEQIDALN